MLSLALQSVWALKAETLHERNSQDPDELGRSLLTFMVLFKIRIPGKVKQNGSRDTD